MTRFLIAALLSLAILLIGGALTGCASQQYAGIVATSVKPVKIDGKLECCEVTTYNGKEMESLKVHIEKKGADYLIDVEEIGVKAFKGQAISAGSIPGITTTLPMLLPQ
jgi:hypothetical protein